MGGIIDDGQVLQADQGGQHAFHFTVGQFFQVGWWQVVTGVFHHVVVDVQPFGIGVQFFVCGLVFAINQLIAGIDDGGGAVVFKGVVEDLDVVVAQGDKTGAARHRRDQPALGEVVGIVVAGQVVEHHRGVAVLGDVFQIVDQEAAGITLGHVVVVFPALHIFDFETHDVIDGTAVTNNGGVGLAHVDAGIGGAHGFTAFHQDVFRFHRVDAVAAAGGTGYVIGGRVTFVEGRVGTGHMQPVAVVVGGDRLAATRPHGAHIAQGAPFDALEFEGVAGGIQDGQVFHGNAANVERFQAGDVGAVFERQHRFVLAAAFDQHVLGGLDQQPLIQIEVATVKLQRVARAQLNHGVDHVFGGVVAGGNHKGAAFPGGRGNRIVTVTTAITTPSAIIAAIGGGGVGRVAATPATTAGDDEGGE